MKKLATILLTGVLTLSCACPVFAADTSIDQNSGDQTKSTNVTYQVSPAYTVTIPGTVKLGETGAVSAENVVLDSNLILQVAVTAVNGDTNGTFKVSLADDALEYTMTKDNADGAVIALNDSVLRVDPANTADGTQTLSFNAPGADPKYAGTYTGTVTFTVSTLQRISN